jgi:hypothetical protein
MGTCCHLDESRMSEEVEVFRRLDIKTDVPKTDTRRVTLLSSRQGMNGTAQLRSMRIMWGWSRLGGKERLSVCCAALSGVWRTALVNNCPRVQLHARASDILRLRWQQPDRLVWGGLVLPQAQAHSWHRMQLRCGCLDGAQICSRWWTCDRRAHKVTRIRRWWPGASTQRRSL